MTAWNSVHLEVLYSIFGWVAFVSWSISFYPQVILNFRRKSVVGLNFDFLVLNLTKHFTYLIYNASIMNVNGWEGRLFVGVNAAISVRVANELGSGHPRAVKYSVIVMVTQSLLIGILFMFLIMTTRNHFAVIFTDSTDLQKAVAKLAYLLAITMVLNSVQAVISGD
ncbi:hypothetical protein POM88_038910 [Heracleum sosnowskyi]|uniref:Uncharacterized protein n=1 Tax=Heracleum sosnowskyi TaxID=360622 RepID=A0AAD8M8A5_9APIA|nr:hypothetical protein POM88_038910 [Heracleum sosnowskyi]